MNRLKKNTNSHFLKCPQIRNNYYRLAITNNIKKNYLRIMENEKYQNERIFWDQIYYKILDEEIMTTQRQDVLLNYIHEQLEVLCCRGFVGVFPMLEDGNINQHWDTPIPSPDSGTAMEEMEEESNQPQLVLSRSQRKTLADYLDRIITYIFLAQGDKEFVEPKNLIKVLALIMEFSMNIISIWLPV